MPDTEWTSPRKMMDYYMDQSDGIEACQKRLYLAVIKGEVRARLKGRVLGPEWLKQIAAMKYDDTLYIAARSRIVCCGREAALAPLKPRLRIVVPATVVLILFTIS